MANVTVEGLTKRFGAVTAVDDVWLTIDDGELFGLLGPSGSGKTTLMRCIAGFIEADAGRVIVGTEALTGIPTHRRDIGMVFQSYALFPHMSVGDNVGFSLRVRGAPKDEIAKRVETMLKLVRLEDYGDRLPRQLSGGQQQRIALARAVVSRPRLLLLDEPLNALDKALRQQMQIELKQIQREVGITTVFVTHDQDEALSLCDRIAIFREGKIAQIGRPSDIYERPGSVFAATFLGTANLFRGCSLGSINGECLLALPGGGTVATVDRLPSEGKPATIVVRPEKMLIAPAASATGAAPERTNQVTGKIQKLIYLGSTLTYIVDTAVGPITVYVQNREAPLLEVGTDVNVSWSTVHAIAVAE